MGPPGDFANQVLWHGREIGNRNQARRDAERRKQKVRWSCELISHNDGKWCWRAYIDGHAFYLVEFAS